MDWAVYLGDRHQAKEATGLAAQPMLEGSLLSKRPLSHDSPFLKHTAATWLNKNNVMQKFALSESYRFGGMIVCVLHGDVPQTPLRA